MICHDPHSTKTHKLVWVLGNVPFSDQVPGGGAHGPSSLNQQYAFFAAQTLKISVYFIQWIKSYSIFTFRHTDRCTFCIPRCTGNIFYLWKIIPFTILCSFVTWFAHSLTSFGKKKFQIRWSKNNLTKNNLNNLSASWLCQVLGNNSLTKLAQNLSLFWL